MYSRAKFGGMIKKKEKAGGYTVCRSEGFKVLVRLCHGLAKYNV